MRQLVRCGTLWAAICIAWIVLLPVPAAAGGSSPYALSPAARWLADPPALVLSIDDNVPSGEMVGAGDEVHYTLVFTNIGGTAISNVRLVAVVPPFTQVVAQASQLWYCPAGSTTRADQSCTLELAALGASTSHTVQLVVQLDDPLPANMTSLTLDAAVTADEVVCGECGLASVDTPVDPRSDAQGGFLIYFPAIIQRR